MSAPKITHIERADLNTRALEHVVQDMQLRLQVLREENDAGEAEVTAKRRGRIAEIKDWLALIKQAQLAARADVD